MRFLPPRSFVAFGLVVALLTPAACARVHAPAAQNPSPMVERARAHQRLDTVPPSGTSLTMAGILPRPVVLFVPDAARDAPAPALVVHFNGAPYVAMHAAARQQEPAILASVHLGAGSGVYQRAFAEPSVLERLRRAAADSLSARRGAPVRFSRTFLTGFSAGYGAIREILGDSAVAATIDGVLLLDGLHVSYVPERTPLADGGALDTARLDVFAAFAERAVRGEAAMVVTHSEIFPGTFASTTETADYLLARLALVRTPVLDWGPGGMQLLSQAEHGRFTLLGFAGNTAPDHVDHYHGMPDFLARLFAHAGPR